MGTYEARGKRAFDVAAASAALVALSPLLALTAAAIRKEDGGPALFTQRRSGREADEFTILKFRSMAVGTANVPSAALTAPTVTKVGRVIRRTNIDELPQLLNILRGDMSIVGPRPPLPTQTDVIEARRAAGALGVRPGLTGLAQIRSYDGMSVSEKVALDSRYAADISLRGDVSIILGTLRYLLQPPPKY